MTDRSEVQKRGINNSFKLSLPFALGRKHSQQHPLTTTHVTKVSKPRRHRSLESYCPSKNNIRRTNVVRVTLRTPRNSICPTNNKLNDYNAPLELNIAGLQALRHNQKTSIKSDVDHNSLLSTQNCPLYTDTARIDQNRGSLTQFAHNTLTSDLYNKHTKVQKMSPSRINNQINTHEGYYHRKLAMSDNYASKLTNATSHTDISPSNCEGFGYFHRSEGKVAQSCRRKPTYEDEGKSKNIRRKCCGDYCCQCSPLCMFLSILAILLVAAAVAALIIALLKPKSVITTVTSTTTTNITTTTSSNTSTTSTNNTSTTLTNSTEITTESTSAIATTDIFCSPTCTSQQTCVNSVCVGIGYLSCTLMWSEIGDGDIVVETPNNNIIYYGNQGPSAATDYGYEDADVTYGTGPENIFWSNSGPVPPTGTYYVCFSQYSFSPPASPTNPITATVTVVGSGNTTLTFTQTFTSPYKRYTTCDPSTHTYLGSFTYP